LKTGRRIDRHRMSSPPPGGRPGVLKRLWLRVKTLAARLFRRELAPGRFETGRASALRAS
jgi:hypothetical protein